MQLLSRFLGVLLVLPKDRRATLRGDHRVDRVFKHENAIAHADRESAATSTLAEHAGDDGTRSRDIARRLSAIASAWPRSSRRFPDRRLACQPG